ELVAEQGEPPGPVERAPWLGTSVIEPGYGLRIDSAEESELRVALRWPDEDEADRHLVSAAAQDQPAVSFGTALGPGPADRARLGRRRPAADRRLPMSRVAGRITIVDVVLAPEGRPARPDPTVRALFIGGTVLPDRRARRRLAGGRTAPVCRGGSCQESCSGPTAARRGAGCIGATWRAARPCTCWFR